MGQKEKEKRGSHNWHCAADRAIAVQLAAFATSCAPGGTQDDPCCSYRGSESTLGHPPAKSVFGETRPAAQMPASRPDTGCPKLAHWATNWPRKRCPDFRTTRCRPM